MSLVVTLFAAGVVLLGLELVLPGAIIGIVGGLLMLAGVVMAFLNLGVDGGALAALVALALVGATIYVELAWLPNSRLARRLSLRDTVSGRSQPAVADRAAIIGREAAADTPLAPSGYVLVDGRRYEAFCRSGYVPAGERLRVVDVDNFRLIVTATSSPLSS